MTNIYTVSFFGHRYVDRFMYAEQRLDEIIRGVIRQKEYVEFLVGRDGDFDQIVSSTIRHVKRDVFCANLSHICVFPYPRAEYLNNIESFETYYDEIEICSESEISHPKSAIQIRNRHMVDRSDLCVFYVNRNSGGAYQTMKYAKRQGKLIINIADADL